MKKQTKTASTKTKKLLLAKEKVRDLQKSELEQTAGGSPCTTTCHSLTTAG